MQKIGVLTSGGDAPGMNACVRAIVRNAASRGLEVAGIRRGYSGILDGDMVLLPPRAVANIVQRGGAFLETSRCEEFKTAEGRGKALQVLQREDIEGLVVIGGEGSLRGAAALAGEGDVKVVGVPATIDNDIYGTDYAIGFDTAVNTALEAVDRIRDTAETLVRPFFVEVMGRRSGFIALEVGLACGAEEILIPEVKTDIRELCQRLRRNFERGKRSCIVIVAENSSLGGAFQVAQQVWERLKIDYRVCVLGHIQRGGSPTARDRVLASKLGAAAVDALLNGKDGHMVGEVNGEIIYIPLTEIWSKSKEVDSYLLDLVKVLAI
jgi:6-phosphofructokinase 1